jgi:drug/metabolite transporter (DMT)-like permease
MKRSVWLVFAVYCLLSSAAWIVAPVGNGTPFFERQIVLHAVVGVGALVLSVRKLRTFGSKLPWVRMVIAGVFFWGVPACLIYWAGSGIPSIVTSATFALLPVVVALVVSSDASTRQKDEGWAALSPTLAAFGGVLLLLPAGLPASRRGWLMLGVAFVAVILVAISGVWMHRLMKGAAIAEVVVIVCFANVAFLMICVLAGRDFAGTWSGLDTMLSLSSCFDLVQIVVGFWLLREMMPVHFATRYLVVPLLTVVEGYVVLRPDVTARMAVGAALLTGGAAWILFSKATGSETVSLFRPKS